MNSVLLSINNYPFDLLIIVLGSLVAVLLYPVLNNSVGQKSLKLFLSTSLILLIAIETILLFSSFDYTIVAIAVVALSQLLFSYIGYFLSVDKIIADDINEEVDRNTDPLENKDSSEKQLIKVLSMLGFSVECYDELGNVEWVGANFEEVHGDSSTKHVFEKGGRKIFDLYDGGKVVEKFELCKRTQKQTSFTVQIENVNVGGVTVYESFLLPMLSGSRIDNFYLIHKRSESREEKTKEIKPESTSTKTNKNSVMSKITGSVAHDFNNILMPIIGNCEIALDSIDKNNLLYSNISEILIASKRARTLVQQVLSYQKNYKSEISSLNIADVLADSLKLFVTSIAPQISLKVLRKVENVYVQANLAHLNQIFVNLFTVVQQSMGTEAGSMLVEQSIIHLDEDIDDVQKGVYVSVTFLQSFEGISDEKVALIESSIDRIMTHNQSSSGLGLSLVSVILGQYGGQLCVEQINDTEYLYQIMLPTMASNSNHLLNDLIEPAGTEHILIVDDERQITSMLDQRLSRSGYKVTVSNNPIEALELYKVSVNEFDLVITDQTMPQMKGDIFSEQVLSINNDAKIVMMTGYSEDVTDSMLKEKGIKELIYKPFDLIECERLIRRTLSRSEIDLDELKNNLF